MADEVTDEIADRIAGVLLALSDVGEGYFDVRLEQDLPDEHPFGALTLGINEMTHALELARKESARSLHEIEEKLALIERQRIAMRELATPIIEVWEGVLCLPVVGVVDTMRSSEMTEALLQAVVTKEAVCTIVDVTGIDVLDTGTTDHLVRMARAVGLLGARCVLTGINPSIAQTMASMGVDLTGLDCHRTLREALQREIRRQHALRREISPSRSDSWQP